jgi:hypothetical protein
MPMINNTLFLTKDDLDDDDDNTNYNAYTNTR